MTLQKKIQKDKKTFQHKCKFVKMGIKKKKQLGYNDDLDVRECKYCGFRYFKK